MVGDVQVANGKRYHKVVKDLVVSLAYQVRTEDGVLVDEFPVSAPLDYLHGHGSLIAGLEKALEGHEAGDRFNVKVGAVGANKPYGNYDENLVQRVPKDVFMGADELMNCRLVCVSWLIPIKAKCQLRSLNQLRSLKLMATMWWLMVTTCWLVRT